MSKPIIALKIRATNYEGHVKLGNEVIAGMTANLSFTTPVPALTALQGAVTDVEGALALRGSISNHGTTNDITDLKTKTAVLRQMLFNEAMYVQSTAATAAAGNYSMMADIITSSGFQLKNVRNPQGKLEMVQNFHQFVARNLDRNQAKFRWKKPLNTQSAGNVKDYKFFRGTTNVFANAVLLATTTKTTFTDTNTTNAPVTYCYWVLAVNNAGDGVVSSDVTVTVLGA